jgi:TatA/E family protein of Tat protein translocase
MPTPGPLELVIILVIALLILGPGKLPDVGAALGKSIKEFRKASSDIQESVRVDTSPLPAAPPAAPAVAEAAPAPVAATPAVAEAAPVVEAPIPPAAPAVAAAPAATTTSEPTPGAN